jgi:hypothetical protein
MNARVWLAACSAIMLLTGCHEAKPTSQNPQACDKSSDTVGLSYAGRHALTNVSPFPVLRLHPHEQVDLVVTNADALVTDPAVGDRTVLCRLAVSGPDHARSGSFEARTNGTTYVQATIRGVPGGLGHPLYSVTVVVSAS